VSKKPSKEKGVRETKLRRRSDNNRQICCWKESGPLDPCPGKKRRAVEEETDSKPSDLSTKDRQSSDPRLIGGAKIHNSEREHLRSSVIEKKVK
jgi:hypothetical protein